MRLSGGEFRIVDYSTAQLVYLPLQSVYNGVFQILILLDSDFCILAFNS